MATSYRNFISTTPPSISDETGMPFYELISALMGKNKTTGGFSTDPTTGKVNWTPMQGSSGFFGGPSRQKAEQYNLAIGAQQMSEQKEAELQQLLENTRLEAENIRTQALKDAAEIRAKSDENLEKLKEEFRKNKAIEDFGVKNNIPPGQMPKFIDQLSRIAGLSLNQTEKAYKDPRVDEAEVLRLVGEKEEKAVKNAEAQKLTAGPGTITTMPGLGGGPERSVTGALQNQDVEYDQFGSPVVRNRMTPPSANIPVNPAVRERVKRGSPEPSPLVTTPEPTQLNGRTLADILGASSFNTNASQMFQGIPGITTTNQPSIAPTPADKQPTPPAVNNPAQLSATGTSVNFRGATIPQMNQQGINFDLNTILQEYMRQFKRGQETFFDPQRPNNLMQNYVKPGLGAVLPTIFDPMFRQ